jgi:carboxylesterase type B
VSAQSISPGISTNLSYRIQLIGQEAGAASVVHHLTYYGGSTRDYTPKFQGAILLSPGFAPPPSDDVLNKKYAAILSAAGVKSLDDLAACDSTTLQQINRDQISKSSKGQFSFGPTTGSAEQPSLPGQLIRDGKFFKGIPVFSGYMTQDVSGVFCHAALLCPYS